MNVKGIIQVGAHFAEELEFYKRCGIEKIIFIEPLESANKVIKGKVGCEADVLIFSCACSNFEGSAVMYVDTTNAGMSSSLLKPKEHLKKHPDVKFEKEELVPVRLLDDLPFEKERYNMLVMDVQGNEMNVLKGATGTLKYIDYIYTEVNILELYENGVNLKELDEYLNDFERVETFLITDKGWGDAVYIRKSLLYGKD